MYYIITVVTLFIALGCGFFAALWLNKHMSKEEQR